MPTSDTGRYRFFHPPRCPGAPPLERGAGPNSGPDWRESVGWKILLPLAGVDSSREGLRPEVRLGRKGRDSGPCISSRWGLWTFEVPPVGRPSPRPSPPEERGEGGEAPALGEGEESALGVLLPPRFEEPCGRFADSPYFFIPA